MSGALEEILLGYPTITEEVMEFAKINPIQRMPVFSTT